MMNKKNRSAVLAAAIALALSGCGGGGGGGDSSTATATPAPAPTPGPTMVASPSLVTGVPASSYAEGTPKSAAYAVLNAERGRCGFGLLAQSPTLDVAAQNHADYLNRASQDLGMGAVFANPTPNSNAHMESKARPGYTGDDVNARAQFAGYRGGASEGIHTMARRATPAGTAQGAIEQVRALLAGPYHAWGLLQGTQDIGIGTVIIGPDSNGYRMEVLEIVTGYSSAPQSVPRGTLATYPCEGSTDVPFGMQKEFPAPIPGRLLPTGPGLYVMAAQGQSLQPVAWTIVESATGRTTAMNLLSAGRDPQNILPPHFVAALPDAELKPSTRYDVHFTGTLDGATVERRWSFTTGPRWMTGGGWVDATGFVFP